MALRAGALRLMRDFPDSHDLRQAVAWACRILAMDGHGDLTLGHVSARAPGRPSILMKRKGLALDEITPADVLTINLDAAKVGGEGEVHLEAVLHTEIYKARPDVGAVIHTHPPYVTAFGATDARLLYLSHDALLFPEGIALYEDSADLVMSSKVGATIARYLENRRAIILRNHGVLIVGRDVRWAVLTAVTLERAVRLQAIAMSLGTPHPIPDKDVLSLHTSKYRDEFLDEYWAYWIRSLRMRGLDAGMPGAPDNDGPNH